jgi:hypothetical protein
MPITQESNLKHSLRTALCEQVTAVRDRRRLIEQKWLQNRRSWMGFPTPSYFGSDTTVGKYRIPSARRVAERTIVRCVKLLTPSVKWFETQPMAGSDIPQDRISNVDAFMNYVLQKRIKSRSVITQLVRCMMLYGMPILKTSIKIINNQVWPYQRAVDPFSFYIFPETSPTTDESELIFEDFLFSFEQYQTFVDKGIVDDIPRSAVTKPEWPYHLTERLAYSGITDPTANVDIAIDKVAGQLSKTTAAFLSVTELWIKREGKLYQSYIAWNLKEGPRIVGFFESQYDNPMYRMCIHRMLPSETYTNSQMEDIVELDNIQNDMFNEFIDAVNWEQGFVAFGGSDGIRRDSLQMKGRAKWDLGSERPQDILQFLQPPVTSTNQLRAWQILNGMIQSMGGAGTITEGQPGRNMPRSGQAVDSLINLGMADIQDLAEAIEQEVLTPGLSDIYKVANMIPDDQLMRIPGGIALYGNGMQSNVLKKQDIIGDYEFSWIGSLQFQDESQRAERLMVFLQQAPMLMQALGSQGYTLNLAELVQMIWRYGLGERGLSQVVVPLQQMQAKLQQMGQMSPMGTAVQNPSMGMPSQAGGNGAPSSQIPPQLQAIVAALRQRQAAGSPQGAQNAPQGAQGAQLPVTMNGAV